jgi:hypothetical protein
MTAAAPTPDDDPSLTPEAEELLARLTDRLSRMARELFLAGVRLGPDARSTPAGTTFATWRRQTLARLTPGTWKHSVADLIPGPRFRPYEIYTKCKDELQRRHPEHNNLSVGTHNALAELVRERAVAKLEGSTYAPAFDGVPLPADAAAYRSRHPVADTYVHLLGSVRWNFGILESNLLHLAERSARGFLTRFSGQPRATIAAALRAELLGASPSTDPEAAARIATASADATPTVSGEEAAVIDGVMAALDAEFTDAGDPADTELQALLDDYDAAIAELERLDCALPAAPNGESALVYWCDDAPTMTWTPEALIALAQRLEDVGVRANALLYQRRAS